jgi:hypothetical protein
MSKIQNKTPEILENSLSFYLKICYAEENFEYEGGAADSFMKLILLLYGKYKQRVVVLIDEYDKPILDHIDDIETANKNREALRGFYGILKSMDAYLRMVFITGVTKFTKTSIFSGLNNLLDITMAKAYAGVCGIPTECLGEYFGEHIAKLEQNKNFEQYDDIAGEILAWYDGYSWDGVTRLLNPFSLLNFFIDRKFNGYWYATGTPKFLIEMIKKKPETYPALKNLKIAEKMLDTFEIDSIEIEPLLFRTGYLTVKNVLRTRGSPIYVLDIPNHEVREAFSHQIVAALTYSGEVQANRAQIEITEALETGDLVKMLDMMRALFASIPYQLHIPKEAYYHSIFLAMLTLLGFDVYAEVSTSRGRIDAILEIDEKVYIMEFKYRECAPEASDEQKQKLIKDTLDEAMGQIDEKGYAERYLGSGKTVHKAAFAFLGRDDIEMRVM